MSSEIRKLLVASVRFLKGSDSKSASGFPSEMIDFLVETVEATVEDDTIMTEDDAITMLLDAGLGDLDSEDLNILSRTISLMTGGGESLDYDNNNDNSETIEKEDVEDDDGTCELCEREVRRTFHHLIPKETHSKYLKKQTLPQNLKLVALDIGVDSSMSKVWLNMYGIMVCRPCHSAIHLAASNDDLAEHYNTLDLLLGHSQIYAFAKYNSKQPVRTRNSALINKGSRRK